MTVAQNPSPIEPSQNINYVTMAEISGMVSGVHALLPLCRGEFLPLKARQSHLIPEQDGLAMIKGVFEAARTLQLAVARVEFQQDVRTAILCHVVVHTRRDLACSRDQEIRRMERDLAK